MNYRRKTEPIKAIQWTGENTAEVKAFLTEHCGPHGDVHAGSIRAADFKVAYEEVP